MESALAGIYELQDLKFLGTGTFCFRRHDFSSRYLPQIHRQRLPPGSRKRRLRIAPPDGFQAPDLALALINVFEKRPVTECLLCTYSSEGLVARVDESSPRRFHFKAYSRDDVVTWLFAAGDQPVRLTSFSVSVGWESLSSRD